MPVDGEISVRRQAPPAEPEPPKEPPEEDLGDWSRDVAPEPAQPEPERDPRLWSKPRGSISPPPGSRMPTPLPSVT